MKTPILWEACDGWPEVNSYLYLGRFGGKGLNRSQRFKYVFYERAFFYPLDSTRSFKSYDSNLVQIGPGIDNCGPVIYYEKSHDTIAPVMPVGMKINSKIDEGFYLCLFFPDDRWDRIPRDDTQEKITSVFPQKYG